MQLDYVDVGMIHYVDDRKDFDTIFNGEIINYAKELKGKGVINLQAIHQVRSMPKNMNLSVGYGLEVPIIFSLTSIFFR